MRYLLVALLCALSYAQTENLLPAKCKRMHMGECMMSPQCNWFLDEGEGECIDRPPPGGGEGGEGGGEGGEGGVVCEDVALELDCQRALTCKWFMDEGEGECIDLPPGEQKQMPPGNNGDGGSGNPITAGAPVTFSSFEGVRNFGRREFETERWGNLPLMYEPGAKWVAFYENGDEAVEHTPVQGWAYFLRLVAQGSLRGMTMPLTVTKEPSPTKPGFSMELLRCETCVIKLQANFYRISRRTKKIEMEYSYYQDESPPLLSLRQQQPSQAHGIWDAYIEALKTKNVQAILGFYSESVKVYYYSGDTGSYNVHDGFAGAEEFLNGIVQPSPLDDMIVEYQSVDWRPSGSAFFVWAASRNGATFVRGVNYLQLDANNKIDDHVIIATEGTTVPSQPVTNQGTNSETYHDSSISSGSSTMTSVTTETGTVITNGGAYPPPGASYNYEATSSSGTTFGPPQSLKLKNSATSVIESAVDYRLVFITAFCFVLGCATTVIFYSLSQRTKPLTLGEDLATRMI